MNRAQEGYKTEETLKSLHAHYARGERIEEELTPRIVLIYLVANQTRWMCSQRIDDHTLRAMF